VRAVVQRVTEASVAVAAEAVAGIGRGLCAFVAAGADDGDADVGYMADKLANLRVFPEDAGAEGRARMACSLRDIGGELLLVPQFTLYGDVRRGRRPDFTAAARPEQGRRLLADLATSLAGRGLTVREGVFGAEMTVRVVNDGPVTILLDSRRAF
jgi:D-tyrosyl-tRNA(Tyr) deacylase